MLLLALLLLLFRYYNNKVTTITVAFSTLNVGVVDTIP